MYHSSIYFLLYLFTFLALPSDQVGKISFLIGSSTVQSERTKNKQAAGLGLAILKKDKIKTQSDSRCEITLVSGNVIRIDQRTEMSINNTDKSEEAKITSGFAWIGYYFSKFKKRLIVRTPSAVCAIRGTAYKLNVDETKSNWSVYKGSIDIETTSGINDTIFSVHEGEHLILVSDFESFKKDQIEEYQQFKNKDTEEFEDFRKQEEQGFSNFVKNELDKFNQLKGTPLYFVKKKIDSKGEKELEWVQWNLERDNQLRKDKL